MKSWMEASRQAWWICSSVTVASSTPRMMLSLRVPMMDESQLPVKMKKLKETDLGIELVLVLRVKGICDNRRR